MRDILNWKKKIPETVAIVTSYPPNMKFPTKQEDPGITTISYTIRKTKIHNALCDLGAGVSVTPSSLYRKLHLGDYSPTTITL
jgi:hypothetical protein